MTLFPRLTMRAPVTIRIDGEIEPGAAQEFAELLDQVSPGPVLLVINSPGGIATEGAALAAEVERHGDVIALGQGIVASAATLPFVAAKRRVLHNACQFMIHDPSGMAWGDAQDMRKAGETLDHIAAVYAAFYSRRTGHPPETIRRWMTAETWLTAEEALALSFCDEIEKTSDPVDAAAAPYGELFQHPPQSLVRLAAERGWTAPPERKS